MISLNKLNFVFIKLYYIMKNIKNFSYLILLFLKNSEKNWDHSKKVILISLLLILINQFFKILELDSFDKYLIYIL